MVVQTTSCQHLSECDLDVSLPLGPDWMERNKYPHRINIQRNNFTPILASSTQLPEKAAFPHFYLFQEYFKT